VLSLVLCWTEIIAIARLDLLNWILVIVNKSILFYWNSIGAVMWGVMSECQPFRRDSAQPSLTYKSPSALSHNVIEMSDDKLVCLEPSSSFFSSSSVTASLNGVVYHAAVQQFNYQTVTILFFLPSCCCWMLLFSKIDETTLAAAI
jgi:hypothetical protein